MDKNYGQYGMDMVWKQRQHHQKVQTPKHFPVSTVQEIMNPEILVSLSDLSSKKDKRKDICILIFCTNKTSKRGLKNLIFINIYLVQKQRR